MTAEGSCQSYALTEKSLEGLPKEVTQGVITVQPSADLDSPAYAAAAKRLGIAAPDSYEAQATDWISIVALTIAKAGGATGTAIRDNVRKITNSNGMIVYTAVDGLAALKAGKDIKYSGASGPCTFTDIGDIRLQVPLSTGGQRGIQVHRDRVSGEGADRDRAAGAEWLMAGAILTTPAIGLTAIYAVLRFPNFAVASHATIGAFAGYCANVWLGWPLVPSAAVAFRGGRAWSAWSATRWCCGRCDQRG